MADDEEETTIEYTEEQEKATIEYTDNQLERYDRYREESDAEFIEDYLTNDLNHYEEDLDTVLEALDLAIQEAANAKKEKIQLRQKGEKIPDSKNIGYLLTFEYEDEADSTKATEPTYFELIYGYDAELDTFCVSIDGRHLAKEHNNATDTYENTEYDLESYLAAMLSNFVRVTDGEAPQEESVEKTLYVLDLFFYRFCSSEEDIESSKEYSSIIEEWDINGRHCYILGNEWDDSCSYKVFIEAKLSQYVAIESIDLEGTYYYSKETCKESIKNLISLIEIK